MRELRVDERESRQHERLRKLTLTRSASTASTAFFVTRCPCRTSWEREARQARRERRTSADHLQVVERFARVRRERGDGFGGVERAAAADGNDVVGACFTSDVHSPTDVFGRRLGPNGNRSLDELAGAASLEHGVHAIGVGSGDEQRSSTHASSPLTELGDATATKYDFGSGRELEGVHAPPAGVSQRGSSGKAARYFLLVRGSAMSQRRRRATSHNSAFLVAQRASSSRYTSTSRRVDRRLLDHRSGRRRAHPRLAVAF